MMNELSISELRQAMVKDIKAYYQHNKGRYILLSSSIQFPASISKKSYILLNITKKETLIRLNNQGIKIITTPMDYDIDDRKNQKVFNITQYKDEHLYGLYIDDYHTYSIVKNDVAAKVNTKHFMDSYYFCGLTELPGGCAKLLYSDTEFCEIPYIQNSTLFFLFGGYGDYFIYLPILVYLAKHTEKLICVSDDNSKTEILRKLLPDIKILQIGCDITTSPVYYEVYKTLVRTNHIKPEYPFTALDSNLDYYEQLTYHLLERVEPLSVYSAFVKLYETFPATITSEIHKLKSKYKYVIGLQRLSSSILVHNKPAKEWSIKRAKALIKKCNAYNIAVVNFEKSDYGKLPVNADYGYLDLQTCFDNFRAIDAFIGIDSCFGHIAGICAIPNIILFGSRAEVFEVKSKYFMPVYKNFSFLSLENQCADLSEKIVLQKLLDMLMHSPETKLLPFRDKKCDIDYKYV